MIATIAKNFPRKFFISASIAGSAAFSSLKVDAQIAGFPMLERARPEVISIRAEQMALATAAGVTLRFSDGQGSETWLDQVPPDLLGEQIASEFDLIGRIEELYPLFGFRGTETLKFQQRLDSNPIHGGRVRTEYTFRQDIDAIPTNAFIFINIDTETKQLDHISGSAFIDLDLARAPEMPPQQAIDYAIAWVRSGRNPDYSSIASTKLEGPHLTTVVYESRGPEPLVPIWLVELVSAEPSNERRYVLVRPDGKVTGTEISLWR